MLPAFDLNYLRIILMIIHNIFLSCLFSPPYFSDICPHFLWENPSVCIMVYPLIMYHTSNAKRWKYLVPDPEPNMRGEFIKIYWSEAHKCCCMQYIISQTNIWNSVLISNGLAVLWRHLMPNQLRYKPALSRWLSWLHILKIVLPTQSFWASNFINVKLSVDNKRTCDRLIDASI